MSLTNDPSEPLPAGLGEILGGYRLDAVLGQGGMGTVYAGTHARLGRRAAVKVLRGSLAHDPAFVSRFFDEARVVNEIRHPNIIDIFDFVEIEQPRRVACVMELVDGPTLRHVLASPGLTSLQAVNVAIQLCDALAAVHAIGVVHRDLKPANVLVSGDLTTDLSRVPSVKVLDFGVAKITHHSDSLRTAAGLVLGTPAYMAPEQIAGEAVSSASDVYALGVVLYELFAGQRLFAGTASAVMKRKFVGDLGALAFPPRVPEPELIRGLVRATVVSAAESRMPLPEVRRALVDLREIVRSEPPTDALTALASRPAPAPVIDDLPSVRPRSRVSRPAEAENTLGEPTMLFATPLPAPRDSAAIQAAVLGREPRARRWGLIAAIAVSMTVAVLAAWVLRQSEPVVLPVVEGGKAPGVEASPSPEASPSADSEPAPSPMPVADSDPAPVADNDPTPAPLATPAPDVAPVATPAPDGAPRASAAPTEASPPRPRTNRPRPSASPSAAPTAPLPPEDMRPW